MVDRWLAKSREHAIWYLVGIAAVVLVAHSLAYNFVTDDAYISFVYSRNFAEHGELAFNLGDPVEGYTNFSWTVLIGALMKLGISPELSSRVLGTGCAIGTVFLVARMMRRALGRSSLWCAVPALLLAGSSGFACWTSGGLETQLFTLLVTAALEAVVAATADPRAIRRAGWLLALAAMTRPEGPLIAGIFGAVHVAGVVRQVLTARRPLAFTNELIAAAWFLGLWAPWFAWRYWYYGHLFPNTYYVKASGEWSNPKMAQEMIDHGFYYIWVWLKQSRLLYVLPFAGIGIVMAIVRARPARFVLGLGCALVAAFYVPYAINVGGDFMGLHRFIMPMFVVAAIAVVLGLEWLIGCLPERMTAPAWIALAALGIGFVANALDVIGLRGELWLGLDTTLTIAAAFWLVDARAPRTLAIAAALALLSVFANTQLELTRRSLDPKNLMADRGIIDTPAFLIAFTEDRAKIGHAMESCFREDDFSIVGGAGAQPYYARMRGIDVFGLVSDRIAHGEKRSRSRAGHTKWGTDPVLASYDPNFVFSCYELRSTAAQPQLGCFSFWRDRGFEEVTMRIPGLVERGEYYTFLAKKARNFQCPGRVH